MKSKDFAVLILAAGCSSRLGQPKQLLAYKKTTLLEYTITCAQSVTDNVFVVLGENQSTIQSAIKVQDVEIVLTEDWRKGIGSSISSGVKSITKANQGTDSIMILLCDQPKITNELLGKLLALHRNKKSPISACRYGESFGVPAIFSKSFFKDLEQLQDDSGAKSIIGNNKSQTSFLNFSEGNIDIDKPEDLKYLADSQKIE